MHDGCILISEFPCRFGYLQLRLWRYSLRNRSNAVTSLRIPLQTSISSASGSLKALVLDDPKDSLGWNSNYTVWSAL